MQQYLKRHQEIDAFFIFTTYLLIPHACGRHWPALQLSQ